MIQIDRNKIYESHGYRFKNFVCLTEDEKKMILEWRNHEKVRSVMVNKDVISLEDHLKFINNLENRDDCYYWLVIDPTGVNVGVLDVVHIDWDKDVGEIGFYLNQDELGKGFQFMIECVYFVFSQLQLGNNLVTVNINNKDIHIFNKYIGVQYEGIEVIGNKRFFVSKHANGKYLIQHYDELNLKDYARFVRRNKNSVNN